MRIAILTINEPLYLPLFFDKFLNHRGKDVVGIFLCRPVYVKQNTLSMIWRYMSTFGLWNTVILSKRIISARTVDLLGSITGIQTKGSVTAVAKKYGVSIETIVDVNTKIFHEKLIDRSVDLILSVSCPQIFRKELIELPSLGCLNIHGSDLPAYQGIMPSFWMLADRLLEAAVTIFYVDSGIDTGKIAGKCYFPIYPRESLSSFLRRSKAEACELSLNVLDRIEDGTIKVRDPEGKASYFGWPNRKDYLRFRKAGNRLW